jgi:hypothetical protein
MTAPVQHLLNLPLGQVDAPAPDLVAAVAAAMNDPELLSLADQLAEKSADLIRLAASQQILQHAVMAGPHTSETPAAILQQALSNMNAGLETAKAERERSDRRLSAFRQSLQ